MTGGHKPNHTWAASCRSWISPGLLCAYATISTISFSRRHSLYELFTVGLSTQNKLEIVVVSLAGVWAAWLVVSNRITMGDVSAGGRLWITLIAALYLATTIWAVMPAYSLYRAAGFGIGWVLILDIYKTRRDLLWPTLLLTVALTASLVDQLVFSGDEHSPFRLGGIRANTSSVLAAALILLLLRPDSVRKPLVRLVLLLYAVALYSAFLSLTVAIISILLLVVAIILKLQTIEAKVALGSLVVAAVLSLGFSFNSLDSTIADEALQRLGRDPQAAATLTGRLPLWTTVIEDLQSHPLGLGLDADRSFALRYGLDLRFTAAHSHNGYLSAAVAAGILGLAGLILATGAFLKRLLADRTAQRSLWILLSSLLALANLTTTTFGGMLSIGSLLCLSIYAHVTG